VDGLPLPPCKAICHFGGYHSSCLDRMAWTQAHVTRWGEVVTTMIPQKAMTCQQSHAKVLSDCPICKQCSSASFCNTQPCEAICHTGGYNTSCHERMVWTRAHVTKADEVLTTMDPAKAMTCQQTHAKVLNDCPICGRCSAASICGGGPGGWTVGDRVETNAVVMDGKWHPGHITSVQDGKYEVELEDSDFILPTQSPAHIRHPLAGDAFFKL